MRSFKFLSPVFILVLGVMAPARADLQETISQLTGEAAQRYVAPIVSGFGADMNAGWYHKAPSGDKFKFSIEGGLVFMGAMLGEGKKSFDVQQQFRLNRAEAAQLADQFLGSNPQYLLFRDELIDSLSGREFGMRIHGATVIGAASDSVRVALNAPSFTIQGQPVDMPEDSAALPVGGLLADLPVLPLFAPQLTLGTVFGTNLTFRWMPSMDIPDIGEFKYFGFGVQHNPQIWMGNKLPVDLSVSFFTQKLSVGSLFEAGTFAMGINASKTLGWRLLNATPYAGVAFEKSTMEFHYDFPINTPAGPSTQPISFELEGDNKTRLTLGLSVHLAIVNLNFDYNLAKYPSISAGLMLGI